MLCVIGAFGAAAIWAKAAGGARPMTIVTRPEGTGEAEGRGD